MRYSFPPGNDLIVQTTAFCSGAYLQCPKTINKSINQSINQSINIRIDQFNQQRHPFLHLSYFILTIQKLNHLIDFNKSINQSINSFRF